MAVHPVNELTTYFCTLTLADETNSVFNGAAFTSLTLTLYDVASDEIINNRDNQPVLNQNGVTASGSGVITWIIDDDDNIIVTPHVAFELHRALFTGMWNPGGGVRVWRHEVGLQVRNLHRVG